MEVALEKVKIARNMSEETTAFTAELWLDGKLSAYVKNDGHGGDNHARFIRREEEMPFYDWCEAQPPWETSYGTFPMNSDIYIGNLLAAWEDNRYFKRLCAKKTVIRREVHSKGQYQYWPVPYAPEKAAQIRKAFPDVVEIINERFL